MAFDWSKLNWGGVVIPIATAVLGAAAVFVTNGFGYLSKSREMDIRMVEISLSILAGENKNTDTLQARKFALRALSRYSGIDIPADDFDTWALKGEVNFGKLPSSKWVTLSSYGTIPNRGWVDDFTVYSSPRPRNQGGEVSENTTDPSPRPSNE